jgi:nucleoside-diphosphate-sugar epimerase
MKIFVAGATGAIGPPLIAELIRRGHTVTGMSRSDAGSKSITELGAKIATADAFDESSLREALRQSEAEVVINQLTSLPKDPSQISAAIPGDRKLRLEAGGNLLRAAQAAGGVRRYIQQLSGFFLKARGGLADESDGLLTKASAGVALSAQMYAELEARLQNAGQLECVGLRYGFFYGPKTWYHPDGAVGDQVRRGEMPIIGEGQAVWSWIHIEDAAVATVLALTAPPGIYNIVDDDPSPVARWLPEFARSLGAPPPPKITEEQAREAAGEDAVYYGTKLGGASNEKAKRTFAFSPRRLEWLNQ